MSSPHEGKGTIEPRGAFDLSRSIGFLEEWPATMLPADSPVLRFACCPEHDWRPVAVTGDPGGRPGRGHREGPGRAAEGLIDQVARILSLDIDGTLKGRESKGRALKDRELSDARSQTVRKSRLCQTYASRLPVAHHSTPAR